eukprot:scaffold7681_cov18-Phaeocystis_antarctica.AAC.1
MAVCSELAAEEAAARAAVRAAAAVAAAGAAARVVASDRKLRARGSVQPTTLRGHTQRDQSGSVAKGS